MTKSMVIRFDIPDDMDEQADFLVSIRPEVSALLAKVPGATRTVELPPVAKAPRKPRAPKTGMATVAQEEAKEAGMPKVHIKKVA